MDARTKKLLRDVVDAGRSILARCGGHSFAEYEADRWFRRTVEREFEIIGEALSRLGRSDPSAAAAVSELPRIVGFRNRIIHAYDAIDDAAVWGIVTSHLPHLVEEIEMVLRQEGEAL